MKKLKVRAREGVRVPIPCTRRHIGAEPVPITLSAFYRRAIKDGDLIVVEEEVTP